LKVEYDDPQVLPMIMVETPEGKVYDLGVAKIRGETTFWGRASVFVKRLYPGN
ncbi:MAG: hypothetical protein F6K24_24475, partial [Okeania sp. SIO2D1]|nr:hypothetical protein [Okeania sp. SIO2D1]